MSNHEYERPWQIMPAKIIKLALEHAQKDDDFDHQVAFLLLDIGVEAALKVYLINKKQDVEKIVFPELLKRVKEELSKEKPNFIQQIEDIAYFHGIRNKLYHQGDGVKPTEDNLSRYSDTAKRVVEELMGVDLKTERKEFILPIDSKKKHPQITFENVVQAIDGRFKYFQESCAIITEKLRPNYGTREFAMQLNYILENWPDIEEDNPHTRIGNQACRLEKFNELIGKENEDHDFVDFLLEDVNHFYVLIALQTVSSDLQNDWKQYRNILERQPRLLSAWKEGVLSEKLTVDQVREEIEQIISWIKSKQGKLDEWINENMENVYRSPRRWDFIDIADFLEWTEKNF